MSWQLGTSFSTAAFQRVLNKTLFHGIKEKDKKIGLTKTVILFCCHLSMAMKNCYWRLHWGRIRKELKVYLYSTFINRSHKVLYNKKISMAYLGCIYLSTDRYKSHQYKITKWLLLESLINVFPIKINCILCRCTLQARNIFKNIIFLLCTLLLFTLQSLLYVILSRIGLIY